MKRLIKNYTYLQEHPYKHYTVNRCAFQIAQLATRAILYEVSCYPAPGLVTPISNGAHHDMHYFTFLDSTAALVKYLILFAEAGFSEDKPSEIFRTIRQIGLDAEQDMFKATSGVNTHKGMVFLLGISCAATAKAIYEKMEFAQVSDIIREMTFGIIKQDLQLLSKDKIKSNGEKLYHDHGLTGVRGEVEAGIPSVFLSGLPFYRENKDLAINDVLLQTLLKIMTICDDTTIVHRHSISVLEQVKQQATSILKCGGVRTATGRIRIKELEETFIKRHISPGGSADLLAVTVFFDSVEQCEQLW